MTMMASLGGAISYIAFIWKDPTGAATIGNEAIMAAAGPGGQNP